MRARAFWKTRRRRSSPSAMTPSDEAPSWRARVLGGARGAKTCSRASARSAPRTSSARARRGGGGGGAARDGVGARADGAGRGRRARGVAHGARPRARAAEDGQAVPAVGPRARRAGGAPARRRAEARGGAAGARTSGRRDARRRAARGVPFEEAGNLRRRANVSRRPPRRPRPKVDAEEATARFDTESQRWARRTERLEADLSARRGSARASSALRGNSPPPRRRGADLSASRRA